MSTPVPHDFFRRGTSHRPRIALNRKGIGYRQAAVDLRTERHLTSACRAIHPQALVQASEVGGRAMRRILARLRRCCGADAAAIDAGCGRWIDAACVELDAFRRAAPALQPDAG